MKCDRLNVTGLLTTAAADSLNVTINGTGDVGWYVISFGTQSGLDPTPNTGWGYTSKVGGYCVSM